MWPRRKYLVGTLPQRERQLPAEARLARWNLGSVLRIHSHSHFSMLHHVLITHDTFHFSRPPPTALATY
ncbi:hypothetical protein CCHR01_18890 [Colletotrichum chrysophilum]|uniref:Uncharacterized protein n=1 Tax=Colletotrichum chrysophilum TaxID=1836956 RepID=A0AAD9E8F8_9PEZI|nr:hypothetical protein CCHR01_18890 [Colletotrichum chrysophilum]